MNTGSNPASEAKPCSTQGLAFRCESSEQMLAQITLYYFFQRVSISTAPVRISVYVTVLLTVER